MGLGEHACFGIEKLHQHNLLLGLAGVICNSGGFDLGPKESINCVLRTFCGPVFGSLSNVGELQGAEVDADYHPAFGHSAGI